MRGENIKDDAELMRMSVYYSFCSALMIISVREGYEVAGIDQHLLICIAAGVISFATYFIFLKKTHQPKA